VPASSVMRMRAALVLLLAAAPVSADYKAYVRGQEAASEGNWAQVETEMQAALAGNAKAQVKARLYGQRFAPYVPQYYLGLAAYKQNECAAALRWFGDASASPIIAKVAEFKGVVDAARADCTVKLAAAGKPVETKPVETKPVATKPVVTTAPTSTTPAKPVVSNPPPTPPVKPVTTQTPPATAPVVSKPVATTTPPTATANGQTSAPAALQTALQNWLSGRYRAVVTAATTGIQGKALAHLHLLRAAAFFALTEIEPANAAAHRASAEQEVRNARRALAVIAPDPGFFSPRFRAFFASVR
jgi:hypothetical protein